MGEWRTYRIGDIADVVGGSTPSTSDPSNFDGDIPWLRPKDLSRPHERYVSRGKRNLSQKGLESCSAQLLPPKSVLLSSRAPIGYVALAKNPIATNQGFRSLILKPGFNPESVYYWLKANVTELERHASGSTFKELSGSALKQIPIYLPVDSSEQVAIAHILGTLDDKIELNRRMNRTLEAIARAIFKSWFIDFLPVRAKIAARTQTGDPVHAKAEGREPVGMDPEIAALFPDSFQDSPLGKIPKGWEASTVGNEFKLTMGQSPPGSTYNEDGDGLPFFQGRRDFGFRFPTRRVFCTAPKRIAEASDTLVSVRAPVGDVNMAPGRLCLGRGLAGVRHASGSRSYTYYSMLSLRDRFHEYESDGTVFGAINRNQFSGLEWVRPASNIIAAFERGLFAMDEMILFNKVESIRLASLRNSLQSELLSGKSRAIFREDVS